MNPPPAGTRAPAKTPAKAAPVWQVYIVRCADGTLYTGVSTDVARRVAEHNGCGKPGARYTRARRPVTLVYQEAAADRSAAAKREYAIKHMGRSAKLALTSRPRRRKRPARAA